MTKLGPTIVWRGGGWRRWGELLLLAPLSGPSSSSLSSSSSSSSSPLPRESLLIRTGFSLFAKPAKPNQPKPSQADLARKLWLNIRQACFNPNSKVKRSNLAFFQPQLIMSAQKRNHSQNPAQFVHCIKNCGTRRKGRDEEREVRVKVKMRMGPKVSLPVRSVQT